MSLFRGKKIDDDLFERAGKSSCLIADVEGKTTRKIIANLTEGRAANSSCATPKRCTAC
ncbi:hypothetical protein KIF59_22115 [Enterobacter cloacae subsp. cloacae]|nr:hypothetical protein [Enterobacter cloacae subsp. cloacae]